MSVVDKSQLLPVRRNSQARAKPVADHTGTAPDLIMQMVKWGAVIQTVDGNQTPQTSKRSSMFIACSLPALENVPSNCVMAKC